MNKETPKKVYVIDIQNVRKLKDITLYLNGKEYHGVVVFINGYNGYSSSLYDGVMCGVIDNSCFTNGVVNTLEDSNGNGYRCFAFRGRNFDLKEIKDASYPKGI